jgi:ubiquinone/menaquinone biosynthesis C-methylase UbiE
MSAETRTEPAQQSGAAGQPRVEYPWPIPPGHETAPVWTEQGFVLDGKPTLVLSYLVGSSGWTDDLTRFHEDTAGTDHPMDRASRAFALGSLDLLPRKDGVVLEVGCSSGYMLRLIKQKLPDALVIGTDYVLGPLEALAPTLPDVPIVQFDLTRCPLPSASVDAVIMANVLEHIKDDRAALAQAYRILRPGGLLILEVPAGPQLYDIYDELLMHHRRYTMARIRRLFTRTGFEIVSASYLGALIYPAFMVVKLKNRRHLSRSSDEKKRIVADNISSTGSNPMLEIAFGIEASLRRWVRWPFGIRCVLIGRRPA